MADIPLPGCTPEPLMSYLKALGVFRLVAEQKDPTARLSWRDGVACIETSLDSDALSKFFLEEYRPTPIVGPWGGRSGFYPDSSEATARKALEAIGTTTETRFEAFRGVIACVRQILRDLKLSKKDDVGEGDNKQRLMRACRNELPDDVLPWLDAVYVLLDDSAKYPPILGTGGNEGSGSYVSTFSQFVVSLLVARDCDAGVPAALFAVPSQIVEGVAVGHFDPGAIGGPNSSIGFGGGGGTNPWDFLLAMEGTLVFAAAAARRIGADTDGKAAFPFTVDPNPVGYGSAAASENVRAEMWMPVWSGKSTLGDLKQLIAEGRAQLGRRQARTAVDFARAAVTLGVSRGIDSFYRYSVVMRNGLSYFASSLGRFPVRDAPQARLIDELDPWLIPFRRMASDDRSPPRMAAALRRIESAILDVCRYGDSPAHMQGVLRAVGGAERELANAKRLREEHFGLRPLSSLSSRWLNACDDGSSEFRLAMSVAFMPGRRNRQRPFRAYLEPVEERGRGNWVFEDSASGVVWSGTSLPADLSAVLMRRVLDGSNQDPKRIDPDAHRAQHPLWSPMRVRPALEDVIRFIDGEVNDDALADLIWGLGGIGHPGEYEAPVAKRNVTVPVDYAVLKLVHLSEPLRRQKSDALVAVRNEPRTLSLLRADRLSEALAVACRRLSASGLPPFLTAPIGGRAKRMTMLPSTADRTCRLLASLIFPLRSGAVLHLASRAVRAVESQLHY